MFKNVIVGVDGTPNGRDAIALARRLADPDGKLTLTFVLGSDTVEDGEDAQELLERERNALEVDAELPARDLEQPRPGPSRAGTTTDGGPDRGWVLPPWSTATRDARQRHARRSERRRLRGRGRGSGYAQDPTPIANIGVAYNGSPESVLRSASRASSRGPRAAIVDALEVVSLPQRPTAASWRPRSGTTSTNARGGHWPHEPAVRCRGPRGLRPPGEELAAFRDDRRSSDRGLTQLWPPRRLVTRQHLQLPASGTRAARCSCCPDRPLERRSPRPQSRVAPSRVCDQRAQPIPSCR